MGAIFCQVKIIRHKGHDKKLETWGNQKCKGANPLFIAKDKIIKISGINKIFISVKKKLIVIEKINKIEAKAWVKKYLIAASVLFFLKLISIRGIILIKLISSLNHVKNQELEETAKKVLETKEKIKIKL